MRNLAEMLRARVRATPDAEALVFGDTRLSFQDLWDRAVAVCDALKEKAVKRGDIVAVATEHSPAQVVAIFGAALADAAFTIVNHHLKREQILHQVSDCDAKCVITTARWQPLFHELMDLRGCGVVDIEIDGNLQEGITPSRRDVEDAPTQAIPTDVGCIIYTSGSTGRAKGVVLPHRTLTDGARIVSGYLGIISSDTLLCLLPFSFDYGLNQVLSAVHVGARAVIFNFAFPQDLFDIIGSERITGMAAVPSLWPRILDQRFAEGAAKADFSSLRYITTAGGPHSEDLLRRLTDMFPATEIIIMYGLTESFRSSYLPASELLRRIGSIGKAVPEVELLVLDVNFRPCARGQKGELYHRGAFVSYGYLNNPELTAAKFVDLATGGPGTRPEPAVRSGDLVSLDADGYIYFHGRIDSLIKSRGYRVSPGEVEEAAMSFIGVRHVAAFGVADEEIGQAIVLAYDSYSPSMVEEPAFRRHLAQLLPNYACPSHFLALDPLPLNPNGKVDYVAIRALWEAKLRVVTGP